MEILHALTALAHPTRMQVFRLLVSAGDDGLPAGAIAGRLALPPSTLSPALHQLQAAGLIIGRRAGRQVIYAADPLGVRAMLTGLHAACGVTQPLFSLSQGPHPMKNVLFLCTGNSARSILAEAILNREGIGRFRAFSAGSQPKGAVHPTALDLLARLNHPVDGLRSKSWDEFGTPDAPPLDFVFTVCDSAAAEECPFWPGQPITAHWGLPDPAAVQGNAAEQRVAFNETYRMLRARIMAFTSLPLSTLDALSLRQRLQTIGQITDLAPS